MWNRRTRTKMMMTATRMRVKGSMVAVRLRLWGVDVANAVRDIEHYKF